MPRSYLRANRGLTAPCERHPAMRINLIYARSRNGVIGRPNGMPWHLPEDMAHFKRLTAGCPVVMGRKTWDSLPPKFRPLPGRPNLVVTRQAGWHAAGATPASGLEQALSACAAMSPAVSVVWVIGGAQLYAQALPVAHRVVVTELEQDFDGDTFAPHLDAGWVESTRQQHTSSNGMRYAWVTYTRR